MLLKNIRIYVCIKKWPDLRVISHGSTYNTAMLRCDQHKCHQFSLMCVNIIVLLYYIFIP